ncbi:iron dicitrate transporter FecR [Dyadobacter beijingensis]|uniref:Iron dicitrate transporter FecR n=1 Tax=Dyadobacter beijingensis TaxID=365489 RepID=A0ABQ2HUE1_9BACT|nr:FecR family protein [Dyadobacter beijingensis]GGM88537.1 iron dicitrate transporter FecR [Dyadobacter beijingensis]
MTPYSYDKLIEKYIAGETSADEDQWMEQYLRDNPADDSEVLLSEKEEIGQRIRLKLLANTTRKPLKIGWWAAVAASVALLAGVFLHELPKESIYLPAFSAIWESADEGFAVSNTSHKPQRLTLEDGSVVILQPNSRISYPEHFGERKRMVYLHGEAFFQVKRDVTKPFIVSTGNLATQVLGTSFNVRSYDGARSVEVQVATGRVSVYETSDIHSSSKNGFILTPNQKVVFDRDSRKMELGIVKNPAVVKPIEAGKRFEFAEIPAADVLAMLEKTYGIDIVVEGDVLRNCLFTGDLNDLPMFDQLDLICKAVNVAYERRGASLFISGEGCAD